MKPEKSREEMVEELMQNVQQFASGDNYYIDEVAVPGAACQKVDPSDINQ